MNSIGTEQISINVAAVRLRIQQTCLRVGRNPDSVTLIGVTKKHPPEIILDAAKAGITNIGENYVQELLEKHQLLGEMPNLHWHFIGHLQRNKVRQVAPVVSLIHAVDSERLGIEIDRQAQALGRRIPVLLQVNTSGEQSKYGIVPSTAPQLARQLIRLPGLDVQGMMTLAAFLDDPETTRPMFQLLRLLRDQLCNDLALPLPHLSMGMTNDFEVAIEEGATMVRIGTAIFGERT